MKHWPNNAALKIGKGKAVYQIVGGSYGRFGLKLASIPNGLIRAGIQVDQTTMVGTFVYHGIGRSELVESKPVSWDEWQAS